MGGYIPHLKFSERLKKTLQTLGERIRQARKAKKLSQEKLALNADIDRSLMRAIEREERNLSFAKLCAIAAIVDCDAGSLCEGLPVASEAREIRRKTSDKLGIAERSL